MSLTLSQSDKLQIEAAQGWLMLGDPASAFAELAQATPEARAQPDVLELEWSIHAAAQHWPQAHSVAERMVGLAPQRAFGWIHRAYAMRRMPGGGLKRAWELLRPAFERFPKQMLIPYNLACYAAQMGQTDEAWDWLQRAVAAAGNPARIAVMALGDTDLEALWTRVRSELAAPGKNEPGDPL